MNILLVGASGFIGRNISAALARAGHRVQPISRRHGVNICGMLTPEDWHPYLAGVDVVINAVGIIGEHGAQRFQPLHTQAPMALFRACAQASTPRVLQISALGADETAFSAYHLSKRAADDVLRQLDLDWFVLRPSLVYGRGGTSADLFMWLARLPKIPVVGNGQQQLQPVHIGDVVATVMQCLTAARTRLTLDIVGNETITFGEWLQQMRRAQGLPPARLLRIPYGLASLVARLGYPFNPMLNPENLRMLTAGYRADIQPLTTFLAGRPASFSPSLLFADAIDTREQS